ncbi:MAG: MazG nucleotide pyrophosphohydrolase domain-containing protein [Pseudomonadota bacterium]
MPTLPEQPVLSDFQQYVTELEAERGFSDQTVIDKCLLLGEEVGELFKAIRTREGLKVDVPGSDVAGELADVMIFLCSIANRCDIDLEKAFREKEAINETRTWQ